MEETAKLQAALEETERLWREEKKQKDYYRKLACERWEKLQEVGAFRFNFPAATLLNNHKLLKTVITHNVLGASGRFECWSL